MSRLRPVVEERAAFGRPRGATGTLILAWSALSGMLSGRRAGIGPAVLRGGGRVSFGFLGSPNQGPRSPPRWPASETDQIMSKCGAELGAGRLPERAHC